MIEITFQFVPPSTQPYEPNIQTDDKEGISRKAGGVTTIRLSQQREIEFSEIGSVRYTVELSDANRLELQNVFRLAVDTIKDTLHTDVSDYSVCLLISGTDPIQSYLDQKSVINAFGADNLNCGSPQYSEINDNTVKISFRQRTKVHS
jgi:hypothetical protein